MDLLADIPRENTSQRVIPEEEQTMENFDLFEGYVFQLQLKHQMFVLGLLVPHKILQFPCKRLQIQWL